MRADLQPRISTAQTPCLAPTLCPNVGATHWVALGRSCRRARSCPEQTNREAGLGNCGRRGAPPDEGEAVPRPYAVPCAWVCDPVARQGYDPVSCSGRLRPLP